MGGEEGTDMGSHDDAIIAPEQDSRDVSQIAPAWFLYGSQGSVFGNKKAPEAVPEHGSRNMVFVWFSSGQRENFFAPNKENKVAP